MTETAEPAEPLWVIDPDRYMTDQDTRATADRIMKHHGIDKVPLQRTVEPVSEPTMTRVFVTVHRVGEVDVWRIVAHQRVRDDRPDLEAVRA